MPSMPTRARLFTTLGLGLGLTALAVGVALVHNTGCSSTDMGNDLGSVESGCRAPSACYALDCACTRASVTGAAPSCLACDPATKLCNCDSSSRCVEPVNVCVGRATEICPGAGARCVPNGSSCDSSGGTPPNQVGDGDGGLLVPHCAFVDDKCCPGTGGSDGG